MAWNPSPEVAAVRDAARKLGAGRAVLCPEIWTGCYREPWRKGHDLVPDAFKHPAKASKSLLMRIVRTGLERGWWRAGDTVADPFGGIGTTGIVGAYSGLAVVCCELEPAFVDLCRANFALHRAKWEALGVPQPVVIQGDSRRLRAVLAGADGCVSSPPYAEALGHRGHEGDQAKYVKRQAAYNERHPEYKRPSAESMAYPCSDGNLAALREGDFAAAISSPPYAESVDGDRKRSDEPSWANRPAEFKTPGRGAIHDGYGKTLGQVGALREGDFAAAISSPPYAESETASACDAQNPDGRQATYRRAMGCNNYGQTPGQLGAMKEGDVAVAISSPPYSGEGLGHHGTPNEIDKAKRLYGRMAGNEYGKSDGQIGRMAEGEFQGCVTSPPYEGSLQGNNQADATRKRILEGKYHGARPDVFFSKGQTSKDTFGGGYSDNDANLGNADKETYWQAVAAIYAEVFALLRPGGHIALICKDYVRDKQRQPLCDRTWALLQHVGFLPVTRVYAMLGRKWKEELLTGETVEREKSRKSFFRRLAERKGSPRIDWEEVLVMQKPATAGGSSCPGETWCRRNGHDDRPG